MSDITAMGDAGKAMPVPRGRYSDTETYDYLDFVYCGDASYIAKKLTTGNPPAEDNEYWQLFARGGTLTENSDVSDTTVTFEMAENRANIFSKESLRTIAGKISKMYSDLKAVAFSGRYVELEGRVTVTNNDLATIPGTAWDAVRGAQIRKDLDKLNSDIIGVSATSLLNDNIIRSNGWVDIFKTKPLDPGMYILVFYTTLKAIDLDGGFYITTLKTSLNNGLRQSISIHGNDNVFSASLVITCTLSKETEVIAQVFAEKETRHVYSNYYYVRLR